MPQMLSKINSRARIDFVHSLHGRKYIASYSYANSFELHILDFKENIFQFALKKWEKPPRYLIRRAGLRAKIW